jgi:HEAT repeat protein
VLYQREGGKIFGPEGLGRLVRMAEEIMSPKKGPMSPTDGLRDAGSTDVTWEDLGPAGAPDGASIDDFGPKNAPETKNPTRRSSGVGSETAHGGGIGGPGGGIGGPPSSLRSGQAAVSLSQTADEQTDTASPVRVVDQFEALKRYERSSCVLVLVLKEERAIEDVDASVELRSERGSKTTIKRFWSTWRSGEEKALSVAETDGLVQKICLSGTAKSGYDGVKLDVELYARGRPGGEEASAPDVPSPTHSRPKVVRFTPALEDPSCIPLAIDALKSGDRERRRKAALALWHLGPVSDQVEPVLIRALSDSDYIVRWRAAGALSRFSDPAAVSALIEATKDRTTNLPDNARWSLAQIGAPAINAIPTLVASLKGGKVKRDEIGYSVTRIINDWRAKHEGEPEVARNESLKAVIPPLITLLKDADDQVREESAHALWLFGPAASEAASALFDALKDKRKEIRDHAGLALEDMGSAAVPALVKALMDPEVGVRRRALGALGSIRPVAQDALLTIVHALKDTDGTVREFAFSAIQRLGVAALPGFVDALKAPDDFLRGLSDEELASCSYLANKSDRDGRCFVPVLVAASKDANRSVRLFSILALGQLGPAASDAVPIIVPLLKEPDIAIRMTAIESLGLIGPAAKDAVPELVAALKDRDSRVRAVEALVRIGPAAKDSLPALIAALKDADMGVRSAAINVLGVLGQAAEPALPALIAMLKDGDKDLRNRAAHALCQLRQATPEVVRSLAAALGDPEESVRQTAMYSVQMLGPAAKDAVPALIACLKDPSPAIRGHAMSTLGEIGPAAEAAARPLLAILNDEEDDLRDSAARALGDIGAVTADVVEGLTKAMRYGPPSVRSTAARVLIRIEPVAKDTIPAAVATLVEFPNAGYRIKDESLRSNAPQVVAALVASLDHPEPAVVRTVIEWLGRMEGAAEAAVPALVERIDDEDGETRMAAVKALGGIGPAAKAAVTRLIDLLHDLDPKVVEASAEALGGIGPGARAAVGPLAAIWKSHPYGSARGNARSALAKIEPGLYGR